MKTVNIKKFKSAYALAFACVAALAMVSCNKILDVDSNYVIDADKDHLNSANDTMYSATGILKKLQAIGDRTILLGEARGDLMDLGSGISTDLKEVAEFNVSSDNKYNNPRDYYAVINNCNYYIAKADTALKNSRNQYIFLGEYAAIKAVRAWTYMQLAMVYGEVPFYTQPILSVDEAEISLYPRKSLKEICRYFLNEDGLQELANNPEASYPSYGNKKIWNIYSKLLFMPLNIVLGDLALWAADKDDRATYLQAAKFYYKYITERNGTNIAYPTTTSSVTWSSGADWNYTPSYSSYIVNNFCSTSTDPWDEVITVIPGDSLDAWGNFSELPNVFNTNKFNSYKPGLVPSERMSEISKEQTYCHYYKVSESSTPTRIYPPKNLPNNLSGDLRLYACYWSSENVVDDAGNNYTSQRIYKYNKGETSDGLTQSNNTYIYRRMLVYLRMAEALNRAGYPRFAFEVLSSGLNDNIISRYVIPEYPEDEAIISEFKFPTSLQTGNQYYRVYDPAASASQRVLHNTLGIHSRGSGYTPQNEYYTMPTGTIDEQMDAVEDLIITEEALEFAFEGFRFFDVMRVALRRNDPSYLSNIIQARKGKDNGQSISVDLTDTRNWYLNWRNQIGIGY